MGHSDEMVTPKGPHSTPKGPWCKEDSAVRGDFASFY